MLLRAVSIAIICGCLKTAAWAMPLASTPHGTAVIDVTAPVDPVGAHAAIAQAQEWLAEIDASISVLQQSVGHLDAAVRQHAEVAIQGLRTLRETFHKEIDGVVSQVREMTVEQLAATRAAFAHRWTEFETRLDGYVADFKLDVQQKKALILARIQAEKVYLQGLVTGLQAKAAVLTAQERKVVEVKIAALKVRAHEVESRFGRLKNASESAWSTLKQGFIHSRQILDDAYGESR